MDTKLPSTGSLKQTIEAFKSSLSMTEEEIRKLKHDIRQQKNSSLWYEMQRYCLTASLFGSILQRRSDTPPDSLVLKIFQPNKFTSAATEWGNTHESVAIAEYI